MSDAFDETVFETAMQRLISPFCVRFWILNTVLGRRLAQPLHTAMPFDILLGGQPYPAPYLMACSPCLCRNRRKKGLQILYSWGAESTYSRSQVSRVHSLSFEQRRQLQCEGWQEGIPCGTGKRWSSALLRTRKYSYCPEVCPLSTHKTRVISGQTSGRHK